jgi:hypothetical protein
MINRQRLNELMLKTRNDIESILRTLETALMQASQDRADPAALESHRQTLIKAYRRYRELKGKYQEMMEITNHLMVQFISTKTAYEAGWDARLTDLQAHAVGEEYMQLRRLLDQIAREEWE